MLNLLHATRGVIPPFMSGRACSMVGDPIHRFYPHVAFSIIKTPHVFTSSLKVALVPLNIHPCILLHKHSNPAPPPYFPYRMLRRARSPPFLWLVLFSPLLSSIRFPSINSSYLSSALCGFFDAKIPTFGKIDWQEYTFGLSRTKQKRTRTGQRRVLYPSACVSCL